MRAKEYTKVAVIYIGSSALYLTIAESTENKKLRILEELEYPLNLGHGTFAHDKVSFEKLDVVCKKLIGFLRLIKEYRIKRIKAVATTAIREAKNKDYILDQIMVKTGLEVKVLDDSEEKGYIYRGISRKLKEELHFEDREALVSYIGTGRLGISFYSQGNIKSSQNIRVGSLKLSEILGGIQEKTDKFYLVVEEYLSSFTYMLESFIQRDNIAYCIASGKEIELIADLCEVERKEEFSCISKEKFHKLYQQIKDKTPRQLVNFFDLSVEKAEILLPSMAIYSVILKFTKAERIIAPFISLVDILLYEMLYPAQALKWDEVFSQNTILSARSIGEKYNYNQKHADIVEEFTLQIFDNTKEIHGLGDREKLLLRVAAILHDVGKFISLKRHYYHSYDIIRASNILGLSNRELEIVASVARYHSRKLPSTDNNTPQELNTKDRVLMAKLAAILRLGDSLDRAHRKKFKDLKIELKEEKLQLTILTNEGILLEEWTFKQKSNLFREVFGIKAELKKKRVI